MKLPIPTIGRIVLMGLAITIFSGYSANAQNMKISGTVKDAKTGELLPGVNVIEKGKTNGTATDINGKYSLSVPQGTTLVFSSVGYATQEQKATESVINVNLQPTSESINELVVIGYGTVKKSDATGSVQAVSSKEFNTGAITSPQQLIAGKSAGVVVTQSSGAPGSAPQIRIRGGSSLTASNDPLIVVDGVPMSSDAAPGQANALNEINPNDIESFTILKDASATAIYGSRASNGVIIITTKKGSKGNTLAISYNGSANVNTVAKYVNVLNATEYKTLATSLAGNLSGLEPSSLSLLGNANTDWQKEIYHTSWGTNQNVSIFGNVLKMPYRISYGYTKDNGILKETDYARNTVSGTFTPSFFDDHLKISINARGSFSDYNYGNTGAISNAIAFAPTQPIMNGSPYGGYFTWVNAKTGLPNTISSNNPVAMVNQTDNKATVNGFIGNIQMDYKFHFLPELRANLNMGTEYTTSNGHNNAPTDAAFVWRNGVGQFQNYNGTVRNNLLDFYLNYTKLLGVHNIDVTAGYSYQHFWNRNYNYQAQDDQSTGDKIVALDLTNKSEHYIVSFFGRLNYTLMDKYLLTFTLRDDGSSRFPSNNRWGLFPAAALGWKINEEDFLKGTIVSDLKLRLGYGQTGQQDGTAIGNYSYLPTWTISTPTAAYQFGNKFVNTYRPGAYNTNLKWEATTTYNIALDYGFLNNRISGSVDFYLRKTTNLLSYNPIADGSNLSNYMVINVGDMENRGIDFTLNARPVQTSTINWNFNFNTSYNKNKITKLSQTNNPDAYITVGGISGGVGNTIQIQKVGYARNSFFVYQQVYGSSGMPIEGLYVDRTGSGEIVTSSNTNKYVYQHPDPTVTLALTNSFSYKNWDLFFTVRSYIGNYIYNNVASNYANYANLYNQSGYFNNLPTSINKTKFVNPQYWSDFYVENGSFFRMDNVSIGYNFKKLLTEKLSGRVNFTVQNVFVITKYSGLDPEVAGGIDNSIYPTPRVFTMGLSLNLK